MKKHALSEEDRNGVDNIHLQSNFNSNLSFFICLKVTAQVYRLCLLLIALSQHRNFVHLKRLLQQCSISISFFFPLSIIFPNEVIISAIPTSSGKTPRLKSATYRRSLNHRSLFRFFCGIYSRAEGSGGSRFGITFLDRQILLICTVAAFSLFFSLPLSRFLGGVRARENEVE